MFPPLVASSLAYGRAIGQHALRVAPAHTKDAPGGLVQGRATRAAVSLLSNRELAVAPAHGGTGIAFASRHDPHRLELVLIQAVGVSLLRRHRSSDSRRHPKHVGERALNAAASDD